MHCGKSLWVSYLHYCNCSCAISSQKLIATSEASMKRNSSILEALFSLPSPDWGTMLSSLKEMKWRFGMFLSSWMSGTSLRLNGRSWVRLEKIYCWYHQLWLLSLTPDLTRYTIYDYASINLTSPIINHCSSHRGGGEMTLVTLPLDPLKAFSIINTFYIIQTFASSSSVRNVSQSIIYY